MAGIWIALIPVYIAAAVTIIKEVFKMTKRSFKYRSDCCCGHVEIDSPEPERASGSEQIQQPPTPPHPKDTSFWV